MTLTRIISRSWAAAALLTGSLSAGAQEIGVTYTTELQTDFNKGSNWVNLLRLDFSMPLGKHFRIDAATLSTAKTREERLIDDLQTFSNIEDENFPLALAVLGVNYEVGKSTFFFGVRNMNEDYFASPVTSFFTNSSCGIFPTLSYNYALPNYPLAAVGIDYKLAWSNWQFETSLYNGTSHRRFTGRENVFRVCPKADGVLSVTSINYQKNDNGYYLGFALHDGWSVLDDEEDAEEPTAEMEKEEKKKKVNTMIWAYVEQTIAPNTQLLLQWSTNPTEQKGCRNYAGAGVTYQYKNTTGGLFTDYADFRGNYEWASELTWKIPCWKNAYVQPTLDYIKNKQISRVVGLFRFGYSL